VVKIAAGNPTLSAAYFPGRGQNLKHDINTGSTEPHASDSGHPVDDRARRRCASFKDRLKPAPP